MPNDVARIKSVIRQYVEACNAGDFAAFQKTLANDMVFMAPDAPKARGKKAASAAVKTAFLDPFNVKLGVKPSSLHVVGSRAFGAGAFTLALTPKSGGSTINMAGKYMHAFRKERNGSWKYTHVIFNNDNPPA